MDTRCLVEDFATRNTSQGVVSSLAEVPCGVRRVVTCGIGWDSHMDFASSSLTLLLLVNCVFLTVNRIFLAWQYYRDFFLLFIFWCAAFVAIMVVCEEPRQVVLLYGTA
jgi:hypothetical protein